MYDLWVPGRPTTKARPKFGKGRAYTPKATEEAEDAIARAYKGPRFDKSVELVVDFYVDGTHMRLREVGWTSPLTGDIDNYVKLVADGLQGKAFKNDRQIASVWAAKHPKA